MTQSFPTRPSSDLSGSNFMKLSHLTSTPCAARQGVYRSATYQYRLKNERAVELKLAAKEEKYHSIPPWLQIFNFTNHNGDFRSEEHTSELQSLMRISYAVFCLKKKKKTKQK